MKETKVRPGEYVISGPKDGILTSYGHGPCSSVVLSSKNSENIGMMHWDPYDSDSVSKLLSMYKLVAGETSIRQRISGAIIGRNPEDVEFIEDLLVGFEEMGMPPLHSLERIGLNLPEVFKVRCYLKDRQFEISDCAGETY